MRPVHRLTRTEVEHLLDAIKEVIPPEQLREVWVFGSKARPEAKGGDIDLWIDCASEANIDPLWTRRIRLILEKTLGDQRYDIVVSGPESEIQDRQKRAFLETLKQKRVSLWKREPERGSID
jgi:predicted nucleotidyltransferase